MNTWRDLWRLLRTATFIAGLLLTLFVFIELLRAFQTLSSIHPSLGIIFLVLLLSAVVAGVVYFIRVMRRFPPVLKAPLKGRPPVTLQQAKSHARYIVRLLERLSENEGVHDSLRRRTADASRNLAIQARELNFLDELFAATTALETNLVEAAMQSLDAKAEKEIRACVRDVVIGVTLSPWHSVDLLVVIYRNGAMLLKIMQVYNNRARLAEQAAILKDVLGIVAAVNILNYSSKLLLNLGSFVPVLGRYADDIAQGVGAGLLTSITGRAAMDRCRAYRGWSRREGAESVKSRIRDFLTDIKGIVINDVLDSIRKPVEAQSHQDETPVDSTTGMRQGVSRAIDETISAVDIFVYRPIATVGNGFGTVGSSISQNTASGLETTWRAAKEAGTSIGQTTVGVGLSAGRLVAKAGLKTATGAKSVMSGIYQRFKK